MSWILLLISLVVVIASRAEVYDEDMRTVWSPDRELLNLWSLVFAAGSMLARSVGW